MFHLKEVEIWYPPFNDFFALILSYTQFTVALTLEKKCGLDSNKYGILLQYIVLYCCILWTYVFTSMLNSRLLFLFFFFNLIMALISHFNAKQFFVSLHLYTKFIFIIAINSSIFWGKASSIITLEKVIFFIYPLLCKCI